MSQVEPLASGEAPEQDASRTPAQKRGMFQDPVVQMMTLAAIGLVILFLATVVGALLTGVIGTSESPRTNAERELALAADRVKSGSAGTGAEWAPYINALLVSGEYQKARATLRTARSSVQATATPELDLAEARLELAQQRYAQAVEAAGKAMDGYQARQDALLAKGGETAAAAKRVGINGDYFSAQLVKAYGYVGQRKWKNAVAMFDAFLKVNPTSSDIYVDRGNARIKLGDKAGAEKDFREALKYVPDDEDAKAGLKKIGAAR